MAIQKFIKEDERLPIEIARVKHYDGNVCKEMLHTVQHFMRPHKGMDFSNPCHKQNIPTFYMRSVVHSCEKCLWRSNFLQLTEKIIFPSLALQSRNRTQDTFIFQERKKYFIEVALNDPIWSIALTF